MWVHARTTPASGQYCFELGDVGVQYNEYRHSHAYYGAYSPANREASADRGVPVPQITGLPNPCDDPHNLAQTPITA